MTKISAGFKRLEAAGHETSKTNEALLAEAQAAADKLIRIIFPHSLTNEDWGRNGAWTRWAVPGNSGYSIQSRGISAELCLVPCEDWDGDPVHVRLGSARQFAHDLTRGLLKKMADSFESESKINKDSLRLLHIANEALKKS